MLRAQIAHKQSSFRWRELFKDFMAAQALARPEVGMLPWGASGPASPLASPEKTYQLIRSAFRPRM
jgi:hypothetical protein